MNNIEKKSVYLFYTFIFAVFIFIYFGWAFSSDYSLINDGDSLSQSYKAFVYYGDYLRKALKIIFIDHTLNIPQFDINIGEGADILQALSVNCFCDPFCLLSIITPKEKAYILFGVMNLLRLYSAGLAFVYMCRYFHHNNLLAILAGTCCYLFNPFTLKNILSQGFFVSLLIFFPLLIVGTNKILNNKSPVLYILTLFFTSLTSIYFLYIITITIAIYGITKAFFIYKTDTKKILIFGSKCIIFGFIAIILAGFYIIPNIYFYTHDSRTSSYPLKIFYSVLDYAKMPFSLTSYYGNPSWGIQIIFSLIVFFTPMKYKFMEKEKKILYIFLIIALTLIIFPFTSQILNVFSYPTTRWMFSLYLLLSYIVVCEFNNLHNISLKKAIIFLLFYVLYCFTIAAIKNGSLIKHLYSVTIQAFIGFTFLGFVKLDKKKKLNMPQTVREISVFLFIIAGTYAMNAIYIDKKRTVNKSTALKSIFDSDATKVKKLAEEDNITDFFRFSQLGELKKHAENVSPIAGVSATQYYWSLTSPNAISFRDKLEVSDGRLWRFYGLDTRPILTDLANVLYFCKQDEQTIPPLYHFENTKYKNIYKNTDFIPFGYTYSYYIGKDEWEKLDSVEKEAILSNAVVLEHPSKKIPKLSELKARTSKVNFDIDYDENSLKYQKGKIITKHENAKLNLYTNVSDGKLAFLKFNNLDLIKKRMPEWTTISVTTNTGYSNKYDIFLSPDSYFIYHGIQNHLINLGYFTEKNRLTEVTVNFSDKGEYIFDDFQLLCLQMDDIHANLQELSEDVLHNVKMETNVIKGEISLSKPKLLCISIPYLNGWEAFVDGKRQNILTANLQYMGLELSEGNHTVELHYKTPFLKLGVFLSFSGCFLLLFLIAVENKFYKPFSVKKIINDRK